MCKHDFYIACRNISNLTVGLQCVFNLISEYGAQIYGSNGNMCSEVNFVLKIDMFILMATEPNTIS